jgi:hypothetical protein
MYKMGWRPPSYTYSQYQGEFDAFLDGISAALGSPPPYAGPALQGTAWLPDLDAFIAKETGRIDYTTVHKYPASLCPGDPLPSVTDLINATGTLLYPMLYATHIAQAYAVNQHFRVDELNTVSCGGQAGISDVYASALWSADVSWQLAAVGADGLNFHTASGPYAVFDASGMARPMYYGMRLFSLGTPGNSKLLPASSSLQTHVDAFATLGEDGAVRVTLINLEQTAGGTVKVWAGGRTRATLVRMRAPSLTSSTGITLAGQSWEGSADGKPVGQEATEMVPSDGTTFSVMLPALNAVVLTISP